MPASDPIQDTSSALPLDTLLKAGTARKCSDGLLVRSPKSDETLLVCALTDLDGTANDEHVPEDRRLATIGPAKQAFALLESSGIVTGVCTARSLGEARHYQRHLGVSGPLIAENGAVVCFPDGSDRVFGDLHQLETVADWASAELGRKVPNSIRYATLEEAWEKERRGETAVFLGHTDKDSLRRSADRRASCFLVGLSDVEKAKVSEHAAKLGIFCFGELLHLIPAGASKGAALDALNEHLLARPAEHGFRPTRVAQIVFGNGVNDLSLFERALRSGGCAVLAGDATTANGFHFDVSKHPVPDGTITMQGVSHGHAILRSLPLLREFFAREHGVLFPW
jgi:HAD superfamily hydrolase (TIGR01484 family)